MQFVINARHSPDLCPTANAKIRQLLKQSAQEMPEIAKRLGVKVITVNVYGPDHEIVAVVEGKRDRAGPRLRDAEPPHTVEHGKHPRHLELRGGFGKGRDAAGDFLVGPFEALPFAQ